VYFSVSVPIIPDYLYTSEQKEYVPTLPLYSNTNNSKFSNKEPALLNSSTLQQYLENSVVQPAQESRLYKEEEMGTMRDKDVFWNMESESHEHELELGSNLKNLNRGKECAGIQQHNHQSTDNQGHSFGNQHTQHRKEKMFGSYKREPEDKYTNVVQYAISDKHALSYPELENFRALLLFQKWKRALVSALIRGHNTSSIEDRRKRGQTEDTKIKFQEKLGYLQNYIAGTHSHTHLKNIKSLMIPNFLHTQEKSILHNSTAVEQNNTGQHSVPHKWNAHAHSDVGPSHSQPSAFSNCNDRYSTFHCET
jgi:hypothetical protein